MTQGQKDQIREEQARQRRQVELQREKERTREQDWSIQEAANNRVLTLLDRQKERMKRELATHIRRENELQAYEDKER